MKNTESEIVMGMHCISELLVHYPKKLIQVFVQDTMKKNPRKKTLYRRLEEKRISMQIVSKQKLENICGSTSHQGFVAFIKKRRLQNFDAFLEKQKQKSASLIVILDHIQDPHNVGAIFRSAECFGVDGVIFSTKSGPSITPSVAKVSSGASEHLPLIATPNLDQAVEKLKMQGFSVYAAAMDKVSSGFSAIDYSLKSVLILGSEGEGISASLLKKASSKVYIPMQGKIQSLNVSAAAAVLLAKITESKAHHE